MKKILAALLSAAAITAFATTSALAAYPSSPNPPANLIPATDLIGAEGGWEDNPDVGRAVAFDGDIDTFYDPAAASDPEHYAGLKVSEPYILTEIRIHPRTTFMERFNGAQIWGFNGDVFDPSTATLIFESATDYTNDDEPAWQIIGADQFIAGSNTGFTHFAYFNESIHGDVGEVELYGNPVAAAAPVAEPTKDETPAPAVETPAPAATTPVAPPTGDAGIIFALAALGATAFVTIKLTNSKNRA